VLYKLSDFASFVNQHLIRYREKVVIQNLKNSFPEKDEQEIQDIAKRFYNHFFDVFFETLKLLHLKKEKLNQHIWIKNPSVLEELFAKKKQVIAAVGHYGNWEWMAGLPPKLPFSCVSVYKPINNKLFDRFMNRLRSRLG
jgi:KDO2-lipid IV(A) lauroyltransferase